MPTPHQTTHNIRQMVLERKIIYPISYHIQSQARSNTRDRQLTKNAQSLSRKFIVTLSSKDINPTSIIPPMKKPNSATQTQVVETTALTTCRWAPT